MQRKQLMHDNKTSIQIIKENNMFKYMLILFYAANVALHAQTVTDLTSKTGTTADLYGIYFINASTGWAVGANSKIIKTTNGGDTWTSQTPAVTALVLRSVYFVNSNIGYTINNIPTDPNWPTLWKTTDGGVSWNHKVAFSGGDFTGGIYFTSDNNGIVVNPKYAFYTSDFLNWPTQNFAGNDVWFVDANNGFVCGGTSLLITTDGKAHWTTKSAGTISGCDFKSVYPLSASTIICVGSNPNNSEKFYKTTNGGTNWSPVTNPTNQACWKVRFGSSTTGYAVGNSGAIARTTDAGNSWTSVNSGKSTVLYSVSYPQNSGVAYVAGASGVILKITDSALPVELTSLTASVAKNGVTLNWNTATETNNYGFEVEKTSHPEQPRATPLGSAEGASKGEWTKIGFVEGNGTTNAPKSYSFNDKSASGKTSYRLKQIDRDGKFEYSQTVEVTAANTPKAFALEQNYPNPFNPTTAISYQLSTNGFTSLIVYDAIGKEVSTLVNEVKEAGTHSVQFDGARLSSGIYFAKLTSDSKTQMRKLVLMK